MFRLNDTVHLKEDSKEYGVPKTAIGAILDVQHGGAAYTVEFIDEEGNTYEDALYADFTEDELELAPCMVTEFDNYKYEFIGKDSPELREQAARAKEEAYALTEKLRKKYGWK